MGWEGIGGVGGGRWGGRGRWGGGVIKLYPYIKLTWGCE